MSRQGQPLWGLPQALSAPLPLASSCTGGRATVSSLALQGGTSRAGASAPLAGGLAPPLPRGLHLRGLAARRSGRVRACRLVGVPPLPHRLRTMDLSKAATRYSKSCRRNGVSFKHLDAPVQALPQLVDGGRRAAQLQPGRGPRLGSRRCSLLPLQVQGGGLRRVRVQPRTLALLASLPQAPLLCGSCILARAQLLSGLSDLGWTSRGLTVTGAKPSSGT